MDISCYRCRLHVRMIRDVYVKFSLSRKKLFLTFSDNIITLRDKCMVLVWNYNDIVNVWYWFGTIMI